MLDSQGSSSPRAGRARRSRLSGVIASGGLLGSRGLSIESVAPLLKRAFEMRGAKAVALSLNSPAVLPFSPP